MEKVRWILLSLLLMIGLNPIVLNSQEEFGKTQISFTGSSTLAPVISQLANDFIAEYETWDQVSDEFPNETIIIYVSSGGSGAGVKAVQDGVSDFGMLAREIKDTEEEKFEEMNARTLGLDALTVSVNPENKVLDLKDGNLTREEIVKIFSGESKTWHDVDEELPEDDIVVVTRDLSGGAHSVFQNNIMEDVEVTQEAIQAPSMGALVQKIIDTPSAIGYASYGITNQNKDHLIPMSVDEVEPTRENILDGSYEVSRPLIIVKDGEYTKLEQAFIDYILSEEGLETIEEMGFIAVEE